jgi:hypothetical protein
MPAAATGDECLAALGRCIVYLPTMTNHGAEEGGRSHRYDTTNVGAVAWASVLSPDGG